MLATVIPREGVESQIKLEWQRLELLLVIPREGVERRQCVNDNAKTLICDPERGS